MGHGFRNFFFRRGLSSRPVACALVWLAAGSAGFFVHRPAAVEGRDTPRPSTPPAFSDEAWERHVARLRERLPGPGFTIVIEKPFVVIGDESPAAVRARAARTVRWASQQLKQGFFERDPRHILDIWLFKDRASYEANAKKLFGRKPHTPYGYYSPWHKALVMNIRTGGGTLVHEIVHPFVEANFPKCPAWFNEGLGSLYEQCGEREGRIVGFTNWRLAGLQKAIAEDRLPSFERLATMSDDDFYRENHYAQARYLLYYLQEHGLLRRYYHAFRDGDDATGLKPLRAVLGEDDLPAFQKRWERYVMRLRFER